MLGGPLSVGWCGGAPGPPSPEGSGEPRLVLGSPEKFLLRAGKRVEASARQPTEPLQSGGEGSEAGGLASVCWGGRGEASGGVWGLCMGADSADTAARDSQSGGLPRPPLVLPVSLGQSLPSSSEDSVNLETFATGDTEAEELSVGLQRLRSWASRAPVRSLPPQEKPLTQALVGPGSRVEWAPGRACTIWIPPMGIRGHGVRAKRCECRGRWLKMFSVPASTWLWKSWGAEKGREETG